MANEKRQLIDVNRVINEMQRCIDESPYARDSIAVYVFSAIIECLKQEPTVDAVEVVHGRWISWEAADNFIPSPDRHECSVCHDAAQVLVNGLELLSPYCSNCGAKMDL